MILSLVFSVSTLKVSLYGKLQKCYNYEIISFSALSKNNLLKLYPINIFENLESVSLATTADIYVVKPQNSCDLN